MYENQLDFIKPRESDMIIQDHREHSYNNQLYPVNLPFQYNQNYNNNYQNYNIIENEIDTSKNFDNRNCIYNNENYNIGKLNEINNEVYAKNQQKEYIEQLDYMNQFNVNIFHEVRPNPLVYNTLLNQEYKHKSSNKNCKKKSKSKMNRVGAAWEYNKNFLKNLKNKMKNKHTKKKNVDNILTNNKFSKINKNPESNEIVKKEFNLGNNLKGLFDPNLKKNELEFPRRSMIQRLERLEKIKNYDVQFGSKVRKLQVYKNVMDMFDDLSCDKEEKNFRKKEKDLLAFRQNKNSEAEKNKNYNFLSYNINSNLESDQMKEKQIKYYNSKYTNNLDFNFAHQEQVIKSLENQIIEERKMRTHVNMKYLQKMKEIEENKIKDYIKSRVQSFSRSASRDNGRCISKNNQRAISNKTKKLLEAYLPEYNLIKNDLQHSKFYNEIDNSLDVVRKQNKLIDKRPKKIKNEEQIKCAIEELRPNIDKIVEKDFKKIVKTVFNKNQTYQGYSNHDDNNVDGSQLESNKALVQQGKFSRCIANRNNRKIINNMHNFRSNRAKSAQRIGTLKKIYLNKQKNNYINDSNKKICELDYNKNDEIENSLDEHNLAANSHRLQHFSQEVHEANPSNLNSPSGNFDPPLENSQHNQNTLILSMKILLSIYYIDFVTFINVVNTL